MTLWTYLTLGTTDTVLFYLQHRFVCQAANGVRYYALERDASKVKALSKGRLSGQKLLQWKWLYGVTGGSAHSAQQPLLNSL